MTANPATDADAILAIDRLSKHFPVRNDFGLVRGHLRAVDDVSLHVRQGEVLGVVGESGCGKSTLGKTLIGLNRPTSGSIRFLGELVDAQNTTALRRMRGRLQYVYQDSGASLDPRWKIRSALAEPLRIHRRDLSKRQRLAAVEEAVRSVGLPNGHLDLYPHELSGGQQRRAGLARILTLHPDLVILDEPTSGLDVSVQATVLKLFRDLRATYDLTYLFISHDLSVVRMMCDRTAVMYLGAVVEIGPTERVFNNPKHPYTKSLLAAIPSPGGHRVTDDFWLEGEPPDPANLPSGCRFRTRCPMAADICAREDPGLSDLGDNHWAACHFAEP